MAEMTELKSAWFAAKALDDCLTSIKAVARQSLGIDGQWQTNRLGHKEALEKILRLIGESAS